MLATMQNIKLQEREFYILKNLIEDKIGIFLTEKKHSLLESRLQKRLKKYTFTSFEEYCSYLFTPYGGAQEIPRLIDAVTTNKTDFFREPEHFHFLKESILVPKLKSGILNNSYKVWSSACSSGEEVFTTAMVLNSIVESFPRFKYTIFGTDISEEILNTAISATYKYSDISILDDKMKKKYFLRGKNQNLNLVRFKKEYMENIHFSKLNLIKDISTMDRKFDLIFCRNVLIYFSREQQIKILENMYDRINVGGHLILGHSEFIAGVELPFTQIAPTIYFKSC